MQLIAAEHLLYFVHAVDHTVEAELELHGIALPQFIVVSSRLLLMATPLEGHEHALLVSL